MGRINQRKYKTRNLEKNKFTLTKHLNKLIHPEVVDKVGDIVKTIVSTINVTAELKGCTVVILINMGFQLGTLPT